MVKNSDMYKKRREREFESKQICKEQNANIVIQVIRCQKKVFFEDV